MGFLKKITRPISRALDKLVPNELKPALPFLAAAAPFMAPGLMSLGGNTMFQVKQLELISLIIQFMQEEQELQAQQISLKTKQLVWIQD